MNYYIIGIVIGMLLWQAITFFSTTLMNKLYHKKYNSEELADMSFCLGYIIGGLIFNFVTIIFCRNWRKHEGRDV